MMRCFATLRQASDAMQDGDLLLFRGRGLIARMIAVAGRSPYTHAARAIRWDDDWFCAEVREFCGGRTVALESQVRRYPSAIDVFEVNPDDCWPHYDRRGAVRQMRRLAGRSYGYAGVCRAALRHVPLVRWFLSPEATARELPSEALHCSQACVEVDRVGGGVDPLPWLADRLTEPGDLARSPFYRYRFTLVPDPPSSRAASRTGATSKENAL